MGSGSSRSGYPVKHDKFKKVKRVHRASKMEVTCYVENENKFNDWENLLKRIDNS